ncbi:nuclear transport factor 2 family protein [Pollutibacter soli]|uniref:YybH family protein n=1 Tax=Pollutibacter soli TaxID=3034157 RepID=UPI003013B83D
MRAFLTLVFFLWFANSGFSQKNSINNDGSIKETIVAFFETLSSRDSIAIKKYCTDDIILYEYGMTWNLDSLIRRAIRTNMAKDFKRINTIGMVDTGFSGELAWATYNNTADITANGQNRSVHWLETVVLKKQDNVWKIHRLHSTLIKSR